MFNKIVVLEPIPITEDGMSQLKNYCKELVVFNDIPNSEEEILKRVDNADCLLVFATSKITRNIIERSSNLKYIGMCCSLYGEKYSNIDLQATRDNNITVLPLKDYGDEGTIEYIVAELINLLHGLKGKRWKEKVQELNSLKVGIIGLGAIGGMTAKALKYFGADVNYYSRTRKPNFENEDIKYLELNELLKTVDVAILCVNRDVLIMDEKAFEIFGNGKILVNITVGTCYDIKSLDEWLVNKNNYYICDNLSISDRTVHVINQNNVIHNALIAGGSMQSHMRATKQTINNIQTFLRG